MGVRALPSVLVALAAVIGGLLYFTWKQHLLHDGWPTDNWSNLWYGDEAVRAGTRLVHGNVGYGAVNGHFPLAHKLRKLRYSLLALLGQVYLPSTFKVIDLDILSRAADAEGRFCHSLLDYFWVFPSHPMNRGTRGDMRDFVHYCREEYAKLSQEEQETLSTYRRNGKLPQEVLMPYQLDHDTLKFSARLNGPGNYSAERFGTEEMEQLLKQSMAASTWDRVVPEVPPAALKYYRSLDIRKLPRVASDWREIGRALVEGLTAGFDARSLLPRELFNMTPADIADLEGAAAERIPVLADGCTATSVRDWGSQMHSLQRRGARVSFNLADRQYMAGEPVPDIDPELRHKIEMARGVGLGTCDTGYIHVRRLPRFYERLPDLAASMGLKDDVLRVQSYLWMGALRGGFHYDEEANVYIQLTGEADVWLIPQNYTLQMSGGSRVFNPPSAAQLEQDPYMKELPFHVFRLRAGDGLVFPAFSYHLFCAQSPERVALNFFFMPRWRRMEYSEADWYSQEAKRPMGLERLAVRQLWIRSLGRLWDEKGRGLIVNAGKNEYL